MYNKYISRKEVILSLFLVISIILCTSPLVYRTSSIFFPYSFLGLTMFVITLLMEDSSFFIKMLSIVLWIFTIFALLAHNPIIYHLLFCLFLQVQGMNYGFRLSTWYVQLYTLTVFFSFLAALLNFPARLIGLGAMILLILSVRSTIFIKNKAIKGVWD